MKKILSFGFLLSVFVTCAFASAPVIPNTIAQPEVGSGVDFSKWAQQQTNSTQDIAFLQFSVKQVGGGNQAGMSRPGFLTKLKNQYINKTGPVKIGIFALTSHGIPATYRFGFSIKDESNGRTLYHCSKTQYIAKMYSHVDYVLKLTGANHPSCQLIVEANK